MAMIWINHGPYCVVAAALLVITLVVLVATPGKSQLQQFNECPQLTSSDLGTSTSATQTGLISLSYTSLGESSPKPFVQINSYHIVCETVGPTKGTYQYVSVIVNYTMDGVITLSQFDFSCHPSNVWFAHNAFGNTDGVISTPPDGNFSTTKRTDCFVCAGTDVYSLSDTSTHCAECRSCDSEGLNLCYSIINCCNYYFYNTCTEYCPLNSNISSSYDCVCYPGYTGSNCTIDIDECENNPCQNSGSCTNTEGSFTCECPQNFTGSDCEIDVDECENVNNPCLNNATCINNFGSYMCFCSIGFTGPNCGEEIDGCEPNPCRNGGICTDTLVSYTCACPEGFTGNDCESDIDECDSSNPICQNNGICTNTNGSFNCDCDSTGYTGDMCNEDIDECQTSDLCQNNGECRNNPGSFDCICPPGFTGSRCENDINECDDQPCQMGTCINTIGNYTCNCAQGITGPNCGIDIDECRDEMNICLNGATCENNIGSFTCLCLHGYTGRDCNEDINECEDNPCHSGSTCEDHLGDYHCNCPVGITGRTCGEDIDECNQDTSHACLNGATCDNSHGSYTCVCGTNWTGPRCEECMIPNCVMCSGVNATCSECFEGYFPIDGGCEMCSQRVSNCISCQLSNNGDVVCLECMSGLQVIGELCKVPCSDKFCVQCDSDPKDCKKCDNGYKLDVPSKSCLTDDESSIRDIIIIVSIVGSVIVSVLLLGLVAGIISGIYKYKERPKMKKKPVTTVFQDHGEKVNLTYMPAEVVMETENEYVDQTVEIRIDKEDVELDELSTENSS